MALSPTSSRSGSAAAAAVTLLSSTTLGSTTNFDVASIAQTYNDLLVRLIVRGATASTLDTATMNLNADAGGNYYDQKTFSHAATVAGIEDIGGFTALQLGSVVAASATAGRASIIDLLIAGYTGTTFHKTVNGSLFASVGTATNTGFLTLFGGVWASTAAVNRIQIQAAGSFLTGSVMRIYGIT